MRPTFFNSFNSDSSYGDATPHGANNGHVPNIVVGQGTVARPSAMWSWNSNGGGRAELSPRTRIQGDRLGDDGGADSPASPSKRSARPKSALWRIGHSRTKEQRLAFLDQSWRLQKHHEALALCSNDLLRTPEDKERAYACFKRYFPSQGQNDFELELLLEALGDFGLKARTGAERKSINDCVSRVEQGKGNIDFVGFCSIIEESRGALRNVLSQPLFKAFKYTDLDDCGSLSRAQLWQLLTSIGLAPPHDLEEQTAIEARMDDLEWDKLEQVQLQDAENLVIQVRELREAGRRTRQREVLSRYRMASNTSASQLFQDQIADMHQAFLAADEERADAVDPQAVLNILADFGCLLGVSPELIEHGLDLIAQTVGGPGRFVDFSSFLIVVEKLRAAAREERRDKITELFLQYDREESRRISSRHLAKLLVNLELLPRTTKQQEALGRFLEEIDAMEHRKFTMEEIEECVQQATERLLHAQRDDEAQFAIGLRFNTAEKVHQLRRAFESVDTEQRGVITSEDALLQAIWAMGYNVPNSKFRRMVEDVDLDHSGTFEFSDFLALVRRSEDDLEIGHANIDEAAGDGSGRGARQNKAGTKTNSTNFSAGQGSSTPRSPSNKPRRNSAGKLAPSEGMSVLNPAMPPGNGGPPSFRHSVRSVSRDRAGASSQSKRLQGEAFSAIIKGNFNSTSDALSAAISSAPGTVSTAEQLMGPEGSQ